MSQPPNTLQLSVSLVIAFVIATAAPPAWARTAIRGPGVGTVPVRAAEDVRFFSLLSSARSRIEHVGGLDYRLLLLDPWDQVATFSDRPFRLAEERDLDAWIADWERNGFADVPPNAALSLGHTGDDRDSVAIAILGAPYRMDGGSVAFPLTFTDVESGANPFFPARDFDLTRVFIDSESGRPDGATATANGTEDTALFVVSGPTGELYRKGTGTYALRIDQPDDVVGFTQRPHRNVTSETPAEFEANWNRRGFPMSPPNAGLAVATMTTTAETDWGLVELLDVDTLEDGSLEFELVFLELPTGMDAYFTSDGSRLARRFDDPHLFIDNAPFLLPAACATDDDCPGSQLCGDEGLCTLAPCGNDAACSGGESCDIPVEGQPGWCVVLDACTSNADCSNDRVCTEDQCRLKSCDSDAQCGSASQSCLGANASAGTSGFCSTIATDQGFDAFLSGASWTTTETNESNCDENDPPLDGLCEIFEGIHRNRMGNIANRLQDEANGQYLYTYFGRFFFFGVNEQDSLRSSVADRYAMPPATLQNRLDNMFQEFMDTAHMNYSTRLLLDEDEGVTGSLGLNVNFFGGPDTTDPGDFVTPRADGWWATTESFINSFPVVESTNPVRLFQQFGGGGGFGCLIGEVMVNGTSFSLDAPLVQFGGGFGLGISEADGFDIGFGGGINLCTSASVSSCIQNATDFYGGGGGANFNLNTSPVSRDNDEEDTLAQRPDFNAAMESSGIADLVRNAEYLYVSCGHGGGLGFQSRPNPAGGIVNPKVFQQTYGYGGGGYSLAIIRRWDPSAESTTNPATDTIDAADYADLAQQLSALVSPLGASVASVSTGSDAFASRGFYDENGGEKFAATDVTGLSFVYAPYHFALPGGTRTTFNTYIPGSSSPASLFFNAPALGADVVAADVPQMAQAGIESLVYTLNPNPIYVDYDSDPTGNTIMDINKTVLDALAAEGIPVALRIPIQILHDSDGVSTLAPIVAANQTLLDDAITLAGDYAGTIETIILGQGQLDITKGFDPECNGFNFSNAQLNCDGYQTALTFGDYQAMLEYLAGLVPAGLPIGVHQTWDNWSTPKSIGGEDLAPQTFLNYWQTSITTSAALSGVSLVPLIGLDLVEEIGTGLPAATARLDTVRQGAVGSFGVGGFRIETGWTGLEIPSFLGSVQFQDALADADRIYIDQLFDQPWKSLPSTISGLPGTTCDHVYTVPHLDEEDPQGPPLTSQLPPVCAPDYSDVDASSGAQPQPACLCLVNNTNYPVMYTPFLSNVDQFPFATNPTGDRPTLIIPPNRVMTYSKAGGNDFWNNAIVGRDGAFSTGVIWKQWPFSQQGLINNGALVGQPVPDPGPGVKNPSLKCVGVSDAQNGASSANAGFDCNRVWFQDIVPSPLPTVVSTLPLGTGVSCVELSWTAKGDGFDEVTGWLLKTLEAPPPAPGGTAMTYAETPIIIIPEQALVRDAAAQTVSSTFRWCGNDLVPTGLDPGTYWFRVQPLSGVPAVDAIDMAWEPFQIDAGVTRWDTVGKFALNFPTTLNGMDVESLQFQLSTGESFEMFPPTDSGVADITLPGKPSGASPDIDNAPYTHRLFVKFTDGSECSIYFVATAGTDQGDQNGKAVISDAAGNEITPDESLSSDARAALRCYIEVQNDQKTFNGQIAFSG